MQANADLSGQSSASIEMLRKHLTSLVKYVSGESPPERSDSGKQYSAVTWLRSWEGGRGGAIVGNSCTFW